MGALASLLGPLSGCSDQGLSDMNADAIATRGDALSTGSTTIPSTGQSFTVQILAPTDGAVVPEGSVAVSGRVAIGDIAADSYNVLTLVDVSGSTASPNQLDCDANGVVDASDDLNGDGTRGDVVDCEIAGILALNEYLFARPSLDVGIVAFGSNARSADMTPTAGNAPFTSPAEADLNASGVNDFEEVARSLDQGAVRSFLSQSVGTGTSFNAALTTAATAFASQPATDKNIALLFSDGLASISTSVLNSVAAQGIIVYTFSVGTAGTGCSAGAALKVIADRTGGVCTEVRDPADLPPVLRTLQTAGLDHVEVGGTAVSTDILGAFSTSLTCTADEVLEIPTAAFASDEDATEVSASVSVLCCADADHNGICDADEACAVPPTVECATQSFSALPATLTTNVQGSCGAVSATVTDYECWMRSPAGRIRNVTSRCTVSESNGQLVVNNPYGQLGWINWTTTASDEHGNTATQSCQADYDLR